MLILAWSDRIGSPRFSRSQFSEEWSELLDVQVTLNRRAPRGTKTERGECAWAFSESLELFVVAHAWSGLHSLWCDGREVDVDFYNPEPEVRRIDALDLSVRTLTTAEVDELIFALQSGENGDTRWRLSPIGTVIIEELCGSAGEPLDPLSLLRAPQSSSIGDDEPSLSLESGGGWRVAAEVQIDAPADAVFALHTGPGGGQVVVERGGTRSLVSLHATKPGRRIVTAPSPSSSPSRHFLLFDEDRSHYAALTSRIDPNQPVALHVPRWRGVASSTLNLFPQCLPLPLSNATSPDLVTDEDIQRYTRMLLATGATHFVVSGGDLFFIQLIRAVQAQSPAIRFDLLWHSNYVQMGEIHDWKLLRQWLTLYAEGALGRIGVVKEGLDKFLCAHGVEAVFIKNVIALDPAAITPSKHDGSVGIWLSGSSDYRKLPYAALLALAQLGRYPLKASGLNSVGRQLSSMLNVPIRRVWSSPIPRAQLYREMSNTAATLYVTLSECSPMLPLESFALGVPCLVGPSSHLFRSAPYLSECLIVEDPLNSALIARKLERVVSERDALVAAYRDYSAIELDEARIGIANLLN